MQVFVHAKICLDLGKRYTCQLFLRYTREIFILGVLGFLKRTPAFPKIPAVVWSLLKKSEVFRRHPQSQSDPSPKSQSSLPVLFTSKIRDCEEGIVIYPFYTWFLFLTWVWVNISLEIVSSKMATTHIFQSGVRNWSASVSWCEIEVSIPHAWDSRPMPKVWELAGIKQTQCVSCMLCITIT